MLDALDCPDHPGRVSVCRVHSHDIQPPGNHQFQPLFQVRSHPHCRPHQQPAAGIHGCIWILNLLLNILDCNQASQVTFLIHQQELLNPVLLQDCFGFVQRSVGRCSDQVFMRHELADRAGMVVGTAKADIAVGQNANQLVRPWIHDGNTADVKLPHNCFRLTQRGCWGQGNRV